MTHQPPLSSHGAPSPDTALASQQLAIARLLRTSIGTVFPADMPLPADLLPSARCTLS